MTVKRLEDLAVQGQRKQSRPDWPDLRCCTPQEEEQAPTGCLKGSGVSHLGELDVEQRLPCTQNANIIE